jgi:hypothetical protein
MKEPTLIEQCAAKMVAAGITWSEGTVVLRRQLILAYLRETGGNLCHTARALQMHRNTLSRAMDALGIRRAAKNIRDEIRAQRSLRFDRRQPQGLKPPNQRAA